ncbi:helix-turn-helix domain-containing protein [Methylobacterium trifolii]|uniref:helix-turn-helix domain-containing protein n=1 Tax=Methylobacterium trifolii TaxID=1003092 RepID=UPI0035A22357
MSALRIIELKRLRTKPASPKPPPTIGERVAKLRKRKGLTQAKLAEAIEMHRSDLSDLERGEHDPRLGTLRKIARGLGITLSKLVEGLD